MTPHEQMIIGALRYALNRRSYIMSTTEDYILRMLRDGASQGFIDVCIQDITEWLEEIERRGVETDGIFSVHDWRPLLQKLQFFKKLEDVIVEHKKSNK